MNRAMRRKVAAENAAKSWRRQSVNTQVFMIGEAAKRETQGVKRIIPTTRSGCKQTDVRRIYEESYITY